MGFIYLSTYDDMKRIEDHVQDLYGNAVVGATVTFTNYPAGTPATIYADSAGTPLASNSVTTDTNGKWFVYLADGRYNITASKEDSTLDSLTDFRVETVASVTVASGKTLTSNNSLTLQGTDNTTHTFPGTNSTLARTDAAQTFAGIQSFSAAPSFNAGVNATGANPALPAATGALQNGLIMRYKNAGSVLVMDVGGYGGAGAWVQVTNENDLSINNPLMLNPNGGCVMVGTTTSGNESLRVATPLIGTTEGSNSVVLVESEAASRDAHISFKDGTNPTARLGYQAGNIYVSTNGSTRMRVDSSGSTTFYGAVSGLSAMRASAASASAPSFSFNSDTDTGMFSPATNSVSFTVGGQEVTRIGSDRRLVHGHTTAIGTSSGVTPSLQVTGSNSDYSSMMLNNFANDTTTALVTFTKSRGTTLGSHLIVAAGDNIAALQFEASDGTSFKRAAQILASVDTTPGTNDMPGRLTFWTTADGASSPTERLRITSDGELKHRGAATTVVDLNSHIGLRSYTVATLPSASPAARLIYVSDGVSNKRLAVSDGTNWRWPDGAVVS